MAQHVDYNASLNVIKTLIDRSNIRFIGPNSTRGFEDIDVAYPSIRGLLHIGQPATETILQKIKSTDDKGMHGRLAIWFYKHYGQRMAIRYFNDLLEENPKNADS